MVYIYTRYLVKSTTFYEKVEVSVFAETSGAAAGTVIFTTGTIAVPSHCVNTPAMCPSTEGTADASTVVSSTTSDVCAGV
jgi:hypothetical protein